MRWFLAVFAAVAVSAALVLGWPTAFRYDTLELNGHGRFVVRIDRLTGAAQVLTPNGWKPLVPRSEHPFFDESLETAFALTPEPTPRLLSAFDLTKISGRASISWQGLLSVTVYNGSDTDLSAIDFVVATPGDADGNPVSRELRSRPGGGFPCKQVTTAAIETGIVLVQPKEPTDKKAEWSWSIVRAWMKDAR